MSLFDNEKLDLMILAIVKKYGVLNCMQICRGLNNRPEWFDRGCNQGDRKLPAKGNKTYPHCKANKCKVTYFKILDRVASLEKHKKLKVARKMRFWDSKYGKKTMDNFSFCYLDDEEFKKQILLQTLIPYVEVG